MCRFRWTHVKAHVAGPDLAHDGVEVGPVVVAQAAGVVDDLGDLQDVGVEQAQGVGIGEHQAGGVRAGGLAQGFQVHAALGVGGDGDHVKARHGGRGRVGAMGSVGDQDLGPGAVAPGLMVLADEQQAGVLTVGAGGGLEGHAVHAGDLAQQLFRGVQHLQGSPATVSRGWRGCSWVKPGRAAASSFTRGLYFMVQEPRG